MPLNKSRIKETLIQNGKIYCLELNIWYITASKDINNIPFKFKYKKVYLKNRTAAIGIKGHPVFNEK